METHGGIIVSLENTNFGRPRYERVFQPVLKGSQRLFGVRGFAMRHAPRSQVVSEASNDPLVLPPKDQTKRRKKAESNGWFPLGFRQPSEVSSKTRTELFLKMVDPCWIVLQGNQ